jgi:hypothetical protein
MNLFGPGKPTGQHTRAAQQDRQRTARIQDANASTRPNTVTVAELKGRHGR